jgi:hypothetical protein
MERPTSEWLIIAVLGTIFIGTVALIHALAH